MVEKQKIKETFEKGYMSACSWTFLLNSREKIDAFLYPFSNYFEIIFAKMESCLAQVKHKFNSASLRRLIANDMKDILFCLIQRVLIWEFSIINRCKAEKGKAKISFIEFIINLSKPDQLAILLKKYPVLKEILYNSMANYLFFQLELIARLAMDSKEVESILNIIEPHLLSFKMLGDSHCFGKRTMLVEFESNYNGLKAQIIYKPRPADLDKNFQLYLSFVNSILGNNLLTTTKIITKDGYAWEEYITHEPIRSEQAKIFYYRLGVLLGIIYTLNGHDMHFENLIAHGENPIFIDLECLFAIPVNKEQNYNLFWPSVCDTCIIPNVKKPEVAHYDFSALLFHRNQISPNKIFSTVWIDDYNIKIKKNGVNITPAKNYLFDKESREPISPLSFITDIRNAFVDYYNAVLRNKPKIIRFVVRNFSGLIKRIIFRPTFLYNKLMIESYHPRLLSNQNSYSEYLKQINSKILEADISQFIFDSEVSDILQKDIPAFFSITDKSLLVNSHGQAIPYNHSKTGIERFLDKIALLNSGDLASQINFIVKALEDNYA